MCATQYSLSLVHTGAGTRVTDEQRLIGTGNHTLVVAHRCVYCTISCGRLSAPPTDRLPDFARRSNRDKRWSSALTAVWLLRPLIGLRQYAMALLPHELHRNS